MTADSVVNADTLLRGRRVSDWNEGSVRYVLLEQDVSVEVGGYGFRADKALVRLETQAQTGRTVRRLMFYLDNARALPGRGATSMEARRLLVTTATTGKIDLETDLLQPRRAGEDAFVSDAMARFAEQSGTATGQAAPVGKMMSVRMAEGPRATEAVAEELPKPLRGTWEHLLPSQPEGQAVVGPGTTPRTGRAARIQAFGRGRRTSLFEIEQPLTVVRKSYPSDCSWRSGAC